MPVLWHFHYAFSFLQNLLMLFGYKTGIRFDINVTINRHYFVLKKMTAIAFSVLKTMKRSSTFGSNPSGQKIQ